MCSHPLGKHKIQTNCIYQVLYDDEKYQDTMTDFFTMNFYDSDFKNFSHYDNKTNWILGVFRKKFNQSENKTIFSIFKSKTIHYHTNIGNVTVVRKSYAKEQRSHTLTIHSGILV